MDLRDQGYKIHKARQEFAYCITFINCQHNRLAAFQKHISNVMIACCHTAPDISDKYYYISSFNCNFRLPSHLRQNYVVGIRFNTTCIHDHKYTLCPLEDKSIAMAVPQPPEPITAIFILLLLFLLQVCFPYR